MGQTLWCTRLQDADSQHKEEVGLVERDPHRSLSDMETRIKKVRAEHEPETEQKYSSAGVAFRIGIDLISGVAFGVLAGLFLDSWLDTKPWMLIVFIILGTAAGIRNVIRTAATLEEDHNKTDNQ
jgi:ATP synthase protein I